MNLGTMTLANGSVLTNHATLKNWIEGNNKGTVTVIGTITNQNSVLNKGSINISSGTFNNYLNIVNDSYIIEQGAFKLFKTSNLTNNKEIQVKTLLRNYGAITNNDSIVTYNGAEFENYNSLINNNGAKILISSTFANKEDNSNNSSNF